MNSQTFEIAQLDEEIRSLKMKLQLKRAQGYALRPEELAHYEYLLAKREEMSNAQHSFNGRNASRTSPQRHSPQRVSPQRVSPQKLPRTNVSLSVADIVSIFRIFDLDSNDLLSSEEFFSMISSLLELRDGVAPSDEMTMNVATSIAHGMVLTDRHGNIARNVEAIALSDFLSNAVRGRLGKLITEVCQVKPNIVQSLRAMHPQQNSSNPHLPKKNQNQAETSTEEGEESFDKAFSRLHDRAAAAVRELDTVELECSKLLEKTPDRKDEVRKLLALCQATVSSFERAKNPGQQLPKPPPPSSSSSSSSSSSTPLDGSDLPPPSPLKRAVSFAPGEMLIFQRGKDEGFRTVRVVELIGSETYVVEHEIETTASHITLLAGEEEPIKPGSKVVYKKKNEATIIQVGSADTFDEEGRPSYLVAVRTYTDASRLSRDHPEN